MPDSDPAPVSIQIAKVALDYLKALAWPLLVIGILIAYQPPLGELVQSLSTKIQAADKLGLGSFSLEVAANAREAGSPALAKQIGELSASAIQALMRTPRSGSMILVSTGSKDGQTEFGLPVKRDLEALDELARKEFISFDEPLGEFLRYVRRLPHLRDDESTDNLEGRVWYSWRPSMADSSRIRNQGYRLTARGRLAVDAITKAVAAQLPMAGGPN